MDETGDSFIHAADKYSRRLGARSGGPAEGRAPREAEHADVPGDAEHRAHPGSLPEGYLPFGEVKDLALLGQWPLLDDRMSACRPRRIISAMEHRKTAGDQEAEAWLTLHAQACAGNAEAQRAFGRVCENGSQRTPADLQRAFFWYYRAGLQGDSEGRRNAERLMHCSSRIAPAALAEPMPIYPGEWRITAHLSEHLNSASVFDFAQDGSAAGSLLGHSRSSAGSSAAAPTCYRGGWAYDAIGRVLTIIFEPESGERRWRNATWQIELLGCKPGSLFGRDRRRVGYTLEPLRGEE